MRMTRTYPSRALACLLGVLLIAFLASAGSAAAYVAYDSPPTISSDQADYVPGARVTLTGTHWQPGESVHIRVNDDAGEAWSRDVDVTAEPDGTIRDSFNLPDSFIAAYAVTATGAS